MHIHRHAHISVHNIIVKSSKLTPLENQSPSFVGVTRDFIASAIETAVDAAEDRPHFFISTPPLCKRRQLFFTHLVTMNIVTAFTRDLYVLPSELLV